MCFLFPFILQVKLGHRKGLSLRLMVQFRIQEPHGVLMLIFILFCSVKKEKGGQEISRKVSKHMCHLHEFEICLGHRHFSCMFYRLSCIFTASPRDSWHISVSKYISLIFFCLRKKQNHIFLCIYIVPMLQQKKNRLEKIAKFWKDQLDKFTERSDEVPNTNSANLECPWMFTLATPKWGPVSPLTRSDKRNKVRVFIFF